VERKGQTSADNIGGPIYRSVSIIDWFFSYFVPVIQKFQEEVLKIALSDIRAVLFLNNAPVHLSEKKLVSRDGKRFFTCLPIQHQLYTQWTRG